MGNTEIRLSGSGGQGLILGALILAEAMIAEGRSVTQSQAFEPVSRGGVSRSDLVASDSMPDYPLVIQLDVLLILDQCAVKVSEGLVRSGGLVLVDAGQVPEPPNGDMLLYPLPFTETARQLGNVRVTNMVALGAMAALASLCEPETLRFAVRGNVPAAYVDMSLTALADGATLAC
ncbi:MAG: 2-oxoacid:acceptor oxidoreductase family protein [bacterium]